MAARQKGSALFYTHTHTRPTCDIPESSLNEENISEDWKRVNFVPFSNIGENH